MSVARVEAVYRDMIANLAETEIDRLAKRMARAQDITASVDLETLDEKKVAQLVANVWAEAIRALHCGSAKQCTRPDRIRASGCPSSASDNEAPGPRRGRSPRGSRRGG
jgi:hypothetical protein